MVGMCVCGHGMDEHERDYGPCHGEYPNGDVCVCVMFEEDDEEDADDSDED